ncbi:MAG TPA: hypothetical protein VGP43_08415, partial [Chitinophagaceae bacterium]|nr:hypothetical protein [Chitinophagaceae bacterium]
MGTIRYVLLTDRPLKSGIAPIDLIYQISGKRKYYRTDKKLFSESWDPKKQQAIYLDKKTAKKLLPTVDYDLMLTAKDIIEFNQDLNSLKMDIRKIEKGFEINGIPYSSEMVVEKLKEIHNSKT